MAAATARAALSGCMAPSHTAAGAAALAVTLKACAARAAGACSNMRRRLRVPVPHTLTAARHPAGPGPHVEGLNTMLVAGCMEGFLLAPAAAAEPGRWRCTATDGTLTAWSMCPGRSCPRSLLQQPGLQRQAIAQLAAQQHGATTGCRPLPAPCCHTCCSSSACSASISASTSSSGAASSSSGCFCTSRHCASSGPGSCLPAGSAVHAQQGRAAVQWANASVSSMPSNYTTKTLSKTEPQAVEALSLQAVAP